MQVCAVRGDGSKAMEVAKDYRQLEVHIHTCYLNHPMTWLVHCYFSSACHVMAWHDMPTAANFTWHGKVEHIAALHCMGWDGMGWNGLLYCSTILCSTGLCCVNIWIMLCFTVFTLILYTMLYRTVLSPSLYVSLSPSLSLYTWTLHPFAPSDRHLPWDVSRTHLTRNIIRLLRRR
jgi:hypothetical protein